MAKKKQHYYVCSECGADYLQWSGRCSECGEWNTLQQVLKTNTSNQSSLGVGYAGEQSQIKKLSDIELTEEKRLSTSINEFDRVLGGGLIAGSVVLIGGDPGIGKSTLLLQILGYLASKKQVLYVTGEESMQQVAIRAQRLQLSTDDLSLMTETHIETIINKATHHQPHVLVVDSIQTIFTDSVSSAPGSVSQLRESAAQLVRFAKTHQVALFLVGHVTKEGAIAGPRVLEHIVDTVLYFEGEKGSRFRLIRAVKNRFGAANELGVFAMTDEGLKAVSNPSAIFLQRGHAMTPGSAVLSAWEGTRPILVEVQALVDASKLNNPRRVTVGFDSTRLAMLLAVLSRHAQLTVYDQDVFVNLVGGLKVVEPAADLAVVAAVVSSLRNRILPKGLVVLGELGLGGEIRPIPHGIERIQTAAKHGFTQAIVPQGNQPKQAIEGLTIYPVAQLSELLDQL